MSDTEIVTFRFYVEDADGYSQIYSQRVAVRDDEDLVEGRDRALEAVKARALQQARASFDMNAEPFLPNWDTVEEVN